MFANYFTTISKIKKSWKQIEYNVIEYCGKLNRKNPSYFDQIIKNYP